MLIPFNKYLWFFLHATRMEAIRVDLFWSFIGNINRELSVKVRDELGSVCK